MAIGANPRYIEQLVIGGGINDADGGAYIDRNGNIVTTGIVQSDTVTTNTITANTSISTDSITADSIDVDTLEADTSISAPTITATSISASSASFTTLSGGAISGTTGTFSSSISASSITSSGDINSSASSMSLCSAPTTVSIASNATTVNIATTGTSAKQISIGGNATTNVVIGNSTGSSTLSIASGSSSFPSLRFYQGNYSSDNANRRYALMADMTSGQNLSLVSFQDDGANYKATALLFNRDTSNTVHLAAGSVATAIIGTNATSTLDIRSESVVTTTRTTMNLFNTYATTINFGGAATSLVMGADGSGTTTLRNCLKQRVKTFTVNDTTPSVAGANIFVIPASWSLGNNITALDDGVEGQVVVIICLSENCSMEPGSSLSLSSTFGGINKVITLVYYNSKWYEIARKV